MSAGRGLSFRLPDLEDDPLLVVREEELLFDEEERCEVVRPPEDGPARLEELEEDVLLVVGFFLGVSSTSSKI